MARFLAFIFSALLCFSLLAGAIVPDRALATSDGTTQAQSEIQSLQKKRREERWRADDRYQVTLELCNAKSSWSPEAWILKESVVEMMLLGGAYAPAWSRAFANQGLAPEIRDLLNSEPFLLAVQECNPGSSKVKNKIIGLDIAGKTVGVVAVVASFRYSKMLLKKLGQMGRWGVATQRAVFLGGFAYTAYQAILLSKLLSKGDANSAEAHALATATNQNIQTNLAGLTSSVEKLLRDETAALEKELESPAQPLTPSERLDIEQRIARNRQVLELGN